MMFDIDDLVELINEDENFNVIEFRTFERHLHCVEVEEIETVILKSDDFHVIKLKFYVTGDTFEIRVRNGDHKNNVTAFKFIRERIQLFYAKTGVE